MTILKAQITPCQWKSPRYLVTKEEIKTYISRVTTLKAPGPDAIFNRVFKILKDQLAQLLEKIFNRCLELAYHPKHFRETTTIALRKPDCGDYTKADNYRPITLLNTLGKILEALVAAKVTEAHNLLPFT